MYRKYFKWSVDSDSQGGQWRSGITPNIQNIPKIKNILTKIERRN